MRIITMSDFEKVIDQMKQTMKAIRELTSHMQELNVPDAGGDAKQQESAALLVGIQHLVDTWLPV